MLRSTPTQLILAALLPLITTAQQSPNAAVAPGTVGPDGAYRIGNGVTAPTPLTRVPPETPDFAQKLRAQGDVVLSLVVQANGAIRDVQVVKSVGYGMDEKAIDSVRKWRFKAGTKDGSAVDVRIQIEVAFRLHQEPKMWGAGPLVFSSEDVSKPPILKSGTVPGAAREPGNEAVVLQFSLSGAGEVGEIKALEGGASPSVPALTSALLKWKFSPAAGGNGPVSAVGRVVFIKGEEQFRYEVSSAFRDSGGALLTSRKAADAATAAPVPGTRTVVTVPLRVTLTPDEARQQLVEQTPPEYPAGATQAQIQGTVVLAIVIGSDGSVKEARSIDGPPELIPAAIAAVKRWRYRPAMFRGEPREATTEVEIPFKLPN
jgi:TonB family protein